MANVKAETLLGKNISLVHVLCCWATNDDNFSMNCKQWLLTSLEVWISYNILIFEADFEKFVLSKVFFSQVTDRSSLDSLSRVKL